MPVARARGRASCSFRGWILVHWLTLLPHSLARQCPLSSFSPAFHCACSVEQVSEQPLHCDFHAPQEFNFGHRSDLLPASPAPPRPLPPSPQHSFNLEKAIHVAAHAFSAYLEPVEGKELVEFSAPRCTGAEGVKTQFFGATFVQSHFRAALRLSVVRAALVSVDGKVRRGSAHFCVSTWGQGAGVWCTVYRRSCMCVCVTI